MLPRVRFHLVLPLAAASFLAWWPALAQKPTRDAGAAAVALVRTALSQRGLWGRDHPLLIASIPAWARSDEKTIIVAADAIIGGTPFRTRQEAEKRAAALRQALAATQTRRRGSLAGDAAQAAGAAADRVSVRRYGGDESYRAVIGLGLDLLPATTTMDEVRRVLGKEEAVRRDVEESREARPLVLGSHVYAGGAIVYQTSNFTPHADQVFRVVLGIPAALRAVAEVP
jgi:hypothetical protein